MCTRLDALRSPDRRPVTLLWRNDIVRSAACTHRIRRQCYRTPAIVCGSWPCLVYVAFWVAVGIVSTDQLLQGAGLAFSASCRQISPSSDSQALRYVEPTLHAKSVLFVERTHLTQAEMAVLLHVREMELQARDTGSTSVGSWQAILTLALFFLSSSCHLPTNTHALTHKRRNHQT